MNHEEIRLFDFSWKKWLKQGRELAAEVVEAKREYEKKLTECRADVACQKIPVSQLF